jgi:hypothetical protein
LNYTKGAVETNNRMGLCHGYVYEGIEPRY